jgi:hypothetical protein
MLVTAALVATAGRAGAQEVRGRVLDDATRAPIEGAGVTLYDVTGASVNLVYTDDAGQFVIRARQAGQHTLRVERIGYTLNTSPRFELTPAEILEVEFRLRVQGILLAPLTVMARRSIEPGREGFARRMAGGKGIFFDPAAVAALQPIWPSDVFRHVEGVLVKPTATGEFTIESLRGWGCMAIFIDNSPQPVMFTSATSNQLAHAGVTGDPRGGISTEGSGSLRGPRGSNVTLAASAPLDLLDVRRLRGVEVYRTYHEIPVELRESFRSTAIWPDDSMGGCGVALVWTTVGW